jgi:hypothetical protein
VTFQKTARAALGSSSSSLVRWISYQTVSSQSEPRASYTSECEMGISETCEVSRRLSEALWQGEETDFKTRFAENPLKCLSHSELNQGLDCLEYLLVCENAHPFFFSHERNVENSVSAWTQSLAMIVSYPHMLEGKVAIRAASQLKKYIHQACFVCE